MAKLTVGKGLDEYIATLNKLQINTRKVLGRSIYIGADIVADEIRKNIKTIPVTHKREHGTPEHPIEAITQVQYDGLLNGFGISKMKETDGVLNVKCGFSGYNKGISVSAKNAGHTNKHQANAMIARAVEGGTSFRKKHPFVAPAVRATKKKAESAMAEQLYKEIEKVMKGS